MWAAVWLRATFSRRSSSTEARTGSCRLSVPSRTVAWWMSTSSAQVVWATSARPFRPPPRPAPPPPPPPPEKGRAAQDDAARRSGRGLRDPPLAVPQPLDDGVRRERLVADELGLLRRHVADRRAHLELVGDEDAAAELAARA